MSKRRKCVSAVPPPPASLRLLASPLQLTYAYIWQVIQQRDVRQYGRVEEFVVTVTQNVPDLLSRRQTAQLLLGLRTRIILELLRPEAAPDPKTIQTLINKLSVKHTKDAEVENCQTNFMVMVQMLLKNLAQRKQFFQDVFPVKYGAKFDTALLALIAGLVCKLEQLLPVPNLSQLGAMISTSMEACAQFIPDPSDLKTLLKHQEPKKMAGKYGNTAISSNTGDCILSSLSYCPPAVEPPKSPCPAAVELPMSPARVKTEELQTTIPSGNPTDRPELRESHLKLTPLATAYTATPLTTAHTSTPVTTAHTTTQNASASPNAESTETSTLQKLQTQRVTLQQWVAFNSLSLPALPPIQPLIMRSGRASPETPKQEEQDKRVITPRKRFACEYCKRRFACESLLREHERIHTGEKPYPCTTCKKSFRSQGLLSHHQKLHTGIRPYNCGHCSRGFITIASLKRHMLSHLDRKPFHCEICNRGFTQSSYFKRHMECHVSQMSFACKHCDKTFPTAFKLQKHGRWHTSNRPHMCERCGKSFLMPSLLKRHMGYHTGERPFLCSHCGKTFVNKIDLKRHQRYHAPKVKTPCPVCQKTFTKYSMSIHMRMHTEVQVHKRLHTDERPYSCDVCGKTYKHPSHLTTHKKSHTGERPWKCDICDKGFIIPATLKKHMLTHSRKTTPGFSNKWRRKSKRKKRSQKWEYENDGNKFCLVIV